MAKITRYTGDLKSFGKNSTGTKRTIFGDVVQSDDLTVNINADFLTGWEAGVDANGFPPVQYFNAIGFTHGELLSYLHQVGIPEWDILQEYHIGSVANVAGVLYASKTNTNIGNDPTADPVNWLDMSAASSISYDNTTSGLTATAVQAAIDEVSVKAGGSPLISVGGSVSGGSLSLSLNVASLDFRDTVATSGIPVNVTTTGVALVVSAGSTLGTVDTIKSKIAIIAINNAGTIELACINLSGGVNLDETTLIDTVAIDATADLNDVFYSDTARTGVAFRVVGFVESTQAVAGTWDTPPSLVQGVGGQALANIGSIGFGQKWVDETSNRLTGITYYNTTGRPITISMSSHGSAVSSFTSTNILIDSVLVGKAGTNEESSASGFLAVSNGFIVVVPPGSSYLVQYYIGAILQTTTQPPSQQWAELK